MVRTLGIRIQDTGMYRDEGMIFVELLRTQADVVFG